MRPAPFRTKLQIRADRRAEEGVRMLGAEIRHLREDAGLPKTIVARLAGIDPTHLGLIEAGRRDASAAVRERIAAALGAESSTRLFPTGGPPIRDRFQARMLEAFLRELPANWRPFLEVAVNRPVRGVIDAVLADSVARRLVSLEAQSELRRLEQQIRWATAKSEALPSAAGWPFMPSVDEPPVISSILLLRSTTSTRELARTFASTLAAAYPADPVVLQRALVDPTVPWPGSGILWVRLEGPHAIVLPGWPRGVRPATGLTDSPGFWAERRSDGR
ncbi:MAG TPA: helix-turn-helix transcriptional regulator [Candidatus Limnocylindrales bacterium]|nr:helix-turn-helix transcriptional regulator [Candidatus Limnocylindrales bacterium]